MLTFGTVVFYTLTGGWSVPSEERFYNCAGTVENYKEQWVWDNNKGGVGHYKYKYLVKFKCSGQDRTLWIDEIALSRTKPK